MERWEEGQTSHGLLLSAALCCMRFLLSHNRSHGVLKRLPALRPFCFVSFCFCMITHVRTYPCLHCFALLCFFALGGVGGVGAGRAIQPRVRARRRQDCQLFRRWRPRRPSGLPVLGKMTKMTNDSPSRPCLSIYRSMRRYDT